MCGILGVFNYAQATIRFRKMMDIIKTRGEDALGWTDGIKSSTATNQKEFLSSLRSRKNIMGHSLYAVVGHCPQPLYGKGFLVANCEIYNWKEIAEKYGLTPKNDAELLLQLFDLQDSLNPDTLLPILKEINGDVAFAYWRDDVLLIGRDLMGVKPLWYSRQDGLAFASEKKALEAAGYTNIREFSPRRLGIYDISSDSLRMIKRRFYEKQEPLNLSEKGFSKKVAEALRQAVLLRLPDKSIKVGILFSGGIDSTILAKICQAEGVDFVCYTAVMNHPEGKPPHDLIAAKEVAEKYGFNHKIIISEEEEIPVLAKKVVDLIEEPNAVKVSVGMPFMVAAEQARADGCRVLLSGLGAEELFAGYKRHKESSDANDECLSGLLMLYERDLYRDDVITMRQSIELRVPFLDKELIKLSLQIPAGLKIKEGVEKYILRKAAMLLKIGSVDAMRPKKAAQYGSKFDSALKRVAKRQGMSRAEYLKTLTPGYSHNIGALCSGGKDSWLSAYILNKQNYRISCLLTIDSHNKESYMFHTASLSMVEAQSEASGIPLLKVDTKGEKEEELDDLKKLFNKAKKLYNIDGIVTGALFSQYQRERIEKVADSAGLKVFSPLWHLSQEAEVRQIISEGFDFVLTAIAAEGLDKSWLGRIIKESDVDTLVKLQNKLGLNVAGEGGEYESLVIDCPLFKKRIVVSDFDIAEEDEFAAKMIINKYALEDKAGI